MIQKRDRSDYFQRYDKWNWHRRRWYDYRRRGFTGDLPLFEHLTQGACHYCGVEPSPHNGIDKVDPTLGYVDGNMVSCCWICNRAKGNLTYDEFKAYMRRVCTKVASEE